MKVLKSRLFIFILSGILFSAISVIAVTSINANQISYTKDGTETTVDDALNNLYTLANKSITFGTPIYSENNYNDNQLETKTVTHSLNKGKYLVLVNYAFANHTTVVADISSNNTTANTLSCASSNCGIQRLSTTYNDGTATNMNSNTYIQLRSITTQYYVTIRENVDTISTSRTTYGDRDFNRMIIEISAIPISLE